jgi:murein DD-endopeptidase MepM/ murein hydrolase activator NlpD
LALIQFVNVVQALTQSLAGVAQRYPRHVVGALAVLMLGTGATAFAVANFAPDVSDVPVRQVVEAVEPAPESVASLDAGAALTLYRTDATRSNDTAESLLRRLGVADASAATFIRSDASARAALLSRPGRLVTVETNSDNRLIKLQARWTHDDLPNNFVRLTIDKADEGFKARTDIAPLVAGSRLAGGIIRSSLFAATDEARIPDAVATQVAEMFSGDIDFQRELRKGDRFSVVYETLQADGEHVRAGRVLSAEFVNKGKTYQAVWFQEPGTKGQYYTMEGNSLRKAFLASPLEYSRITSGYGGRVHPISRQFKNHTGVDYAAPTGTSVRTVGDGVVSFAGSQGGYGNVVEVKHQGGKSTLFAHLSRIGVKVGQKVEQGDVVGAVGTTGYSTGPHLHFEFRVSGVHHNPLTIASQNESVPLSPSARVAFNSAVGDIRINLAAARTMTVASAQ